MNSKCIITNFKVRTKKFLDKNSREYLLLAWGWQYHVRTLKEKKTLDIKIYKSAIIKIKLSVWCIIIYKNIESLCWRAETNIIL